MIIRYKGVPYFMKYQYIDAASRVLVKNHISMWRVEYIPLHVEMLSEIGIPQPLTQGGIK